jgi:hypothetical protein
MDVIYVVRDGNGKPMIVYALNIADAINKLENAGIKNWEFVYAHSIEVLNNNWGGE